VFLKRQKEAANQMATLICKKVVDARAVVDYMIKHSNTSDGLEKVLEIYRRHIDNAVDKSIGRFSDWCPSSFTRKIDQMKQEVVDYSLEILPKHTREIERYMDEAWKVQETLSYRLSRVTPDEFEDIIHPIFQADEWILLFVGGFLGVIIGLLQAWALCSIH
jgi:hypothetical protein